jgi:hypothetical protein
VGKVLASLTFCLRHVDDSDARAQPKRVVRCPTDGQQEWDLLPDNTRLGVYPRQGIELVTTYSKSYKKHLQRAQKRKCGQKLASPECDRLRLLLTQLCRCFSGSTLSERSAVRRLVAPPSAPLLRPIVITPPGRGCHLLIRFLPNLILAQV